MFTDRLSRVLRLDRAGGGSSDRRPSSHAGSKLESIRSYAEFCRGGQAPAYPLELFLEISNICDLKCAMCVEFSALNAHRLDLIGSRARGFMDQGEISENLQTVLGHALLVHCFGYGEPTIHPTFRSFLELISDYEVLIDFFTNGMHLDEEFCRFLVDRRVYKITVSFSGATRETYESIYLGGDFEKVLGGIKRLAEAKRMRGTRYPIIEINSLGFRDHVDRFDEFVTLMADHGANRVLLKPLQAYATVPALFEHVSIMRPRIEGRIVRRAQAIGRLRGIEVDPALYTQRAVADDREYDSRMAALKEQAEQALAGSGRAFGDNPVAQFEAIAGGLEPIRNPNAERRSQQVLSLDSPAPIARSVLGVRPLEEGVEPFHCMEPFKTLYVSRNGGAKPCCFANPTGWYLGDAKADDAASIWQGQGFSLTRSAIAEGQYPMTSCEVCLQQKSGPQGHFARHLLGNYLDWHGRHFSDDLRTLLDRQMPDALDLIASTPQAIMARARRTTALTSSDRRSEPPSWNQPKAERPEEFRSSRSSYLHRDFVAPHGFAPPRRPADRSDRLPPDVSELLHLFGQRVYGGTGSIASVGMPAAALESLSAGLSANPRIESILGAFGARRDKVVERFDLSDDPMAGLDRFVETRKGGLNVRWQPSKAIEICLIHGGPNCYRFQQALFRLAPAFVPGITTLVVNDFYQHTYMSWKVAMGLLAESFEWQGQAGFAAVFRYLKPLRAEATAVSHLDLPPELALKLHRQWHSEQLPRNVQIRLDLSYCLLLAATQGQEQGSAHLDSVESRYRDLLSPAGVRHPGYDRMLARVRDACAAGTLSRDEARP